ncbi:MAG: NAD(P)/FAD-dependent oxidoreductase [Christensenellales bacterium]|jgi:thioredoxin reductase (NADPH)
MLYDVAVLGGGPGGLTSALYALRGGLKTVLIEGAGIGGLSLLTAEIENYPGLDRISGYELCEKIKSQVERFGGEFLYDNVRSMDLKSELKTLDTEYSGSIQARVVILAIGTHPRGLSLENEAELIGSGISFCATCDGNFYKNKTVAVVGGGNTALTEAMYLSRIAKKVYLIHRRDTYRADRILSDRLAKTDVEPILSAQVTRYLGNPLHGLILSTPEGEREIAVDGLFIAAGTIPNTSLVQGQVDCDERGYIITDDNMKTSLDKVYAVGDVRQKHLRQIITACADGAIAGEQATLVLL